MDIGVLGPMEVLVEGEPVGLGGPRQRALLALLVAAAPRLVSGDSLIEGIWGEEASSGARSTLQTHVSNLRHLLGEVIVHDRGGYRLDVDPESIDAVRFTRILEEGRRLVSTDPDGVASRLREALSWWRGRPYADLVDVPGLEPEVRRLEELRLEAVEIRVDAELAAGFHGTLIAELEALAEEHPMRERFRAQHMLALYRSGRQSEALRAYRRTESFLADELGVEPSEELQELELKILEHDDSLSDAGRAVTQRLAFLVTDIEGSTRLWDRHPQAMADALAIHDRVLRETIEEAGGRVFKYTGDGVLAVFPDAGAAVAAAEAAQRELAGTDWGEVGSIRVRMGADVGEAEARGGDFFGPPLNRAARLCAIAHGGQVLVSASAQTEVMAAASPGLQVRNLGEFHLRGMASPERVSQLVFVGLPADFPELRVDAESPLDDRVEVVSLPGYEVRERIGEGAFGVVWRAYQPSVGREVAIKVIRPELASQPSFVRRFEAEARTIARVAHPHIVPLIDFWRDADSAYLVLGLLPGGSLAEALAQGNVDRAAGRRVLTQIGTALDHAHSQGLAHGDLKPANVLLDGAGNAYLSDFGIATRLLYPEVVSSFTSESAYRAPEESQRGPSPAADLYALGVMAGELLDGTPEAEAVVSRATAATPGDRYPSAAALLTELDQALGEEPTETKLPVVSRNPYKGLRAFDEADAADFFGRDELVATLLAAVTEHRFVAVVGPSGSGKSSVVRAGLIPALAQGEVDGSERWLHTVLTPGLDPLQSVADALQTVSTRSVTPETLEETGLDTVTDGDLVLVVDQLEELYTMVDDIDARDRFIDLLVTAAEDEGSRVRVVATLRADFYDRPLEDERLGRLVRDGLVTVLAPTREGLVEMITAPSQAVGLRWEPGLAHRIAEDVAHQPGSLPLLQYALTELVERRSGDLLTATDYTRVGGVAGALATRAEDVYRDLTPSQQEAVRQVMLRLVTVDEETDDTRRRVRRSELESVGIPRSDLETVLDTLTLQRLLLADRDPATRGPTVEVAHEALLREWPRLAGWVDDQREALILGRRFRAALSDWDHNDRNDDYLLTGGRLAPFTGWAETAALTGDEQDYYRKSQTKDHQERAVRRRRRRTLTAVLAGAALVASTFGIIAAVQAQRATDQADRALAAEARAEEEADRATLEAERAETEADRARASELSAFAAAAISSDPALAKLLAVASTQIFDPTLDTISILHRAWAADPATARYALPEDRAVAFLWTDLHPDGIKLVAGGTFAGAADHLAVYDFDRGEQWVWTTGDRRVAVDQPRFTSDGSKVVGGLFVRGNPEEVPVEAPLGVGIWDAETGELVQHIDLGECGVLVTGISDSHVVAHLLKSENCWLDFGPENNETLILIELETGDQRVLSTDPWTWGSVLSGDGRYVAYEYLAETEDEAGVETQVMMSIVEEVATGRRVLEFPLVQDDQLDWGVRALNHDGSLLLSGDRPIAVWDVESGGRLAAFDGHAGISSFATFSVTGDTVYSTGEEGTLIHWDAVAGGEIASVSPVGSGNVSVAGDSVLVSGLSAHNAAVVDLKTRGEVWAVDTCGEFVLSNTLSVGGDYALLGEACPHGGVDTFLIDLANRNVANVVPGGMHQGMSISPDGTRLVRSEEVGDRESGTGSSGSSWTGPITVRDTRSGEILAELEGICSWDRSLQGVKPSEQEGCAPYPETPFPMQSWAVRWSPDNRLVAVSGHPTATNATVVWDADRGTMLWGYDGCGGIGAEDHIFTSDGSQLILFCSEAYRIEVLDVATGELDLAVDFDQTVPGSDRVGFIGYTPEGSTLIAVSGVNGSTGASLLWLDASTLEIDHIEESVHDGTVRAWAMSPSGSLIATGSADGVVKVWDVDRRVQVHEIAVGDEQIPGVAFLTEEHLAVTPRTGGFYVYTLNVDELVEIVRGSLNREFTTAECEKYGFGEDCSTLEELRGGRS